MSEPKSVLVLHPERQVPPGDVVDGEAPSLDLDCLVASQRPGEAVLHLWTRQVNYKNNRVVVNEEPVAYLQGPGHGRGAQDYQERIPLRAGLLRPGVNTIRFTAGRDVSQGEQGHRYDSYSIQDVRLVYEEYGVVGGPSVWFGVIGVAAALAGLVLAVARR